MMIAGSGAVALGVILGIVIVVVVLFGLYVLVRSVRIVQQGSVGVVKRFGEFRTVRQPGLQVLAPFMDRMTKVDMREFPMTGDQQAVITKDNVSLWVSATIFCQVIDVKAALFEIADYVLAVDQLSRTALRAVFGELTLDQSLSERETINTRMQEHMADAAMKWGVRLNRIEILDITPPNNVLQAMSEQKEAEQHKRAAILKSEGEQQSAINSAGGRKQAAVLEAEGSKQAVILAAEAQMKALELQAEGEKKARLLDGEGEAAALDAIDQVGDPSQHACRNAAPRSPGHRLSAQLQGGRALRGSGPGRRGRGAGRGAQGRGRSDVRCDHQRRRRIRGCRSPAVWGLKRPRRARLTEEVALDDSDAGPQGASLRYIHLLICGGAPHRTWSGRPHRRHDLPS